MSLTGANIRPHVKTVITMPTPTVVDGHPVDWAPTSVTRTVAGLHVIMMYPKGGTPQDVTYFRSIPTQLEEYTFMDPFSYGSAIINFPQITAFDDLDALGFLGTEENPANVDIWFYAMTPGSDFMDPLTQQIALTYGTGELIWEGFIASRDLTSDEASDGLTVQCQGALFELDGYKQKPFYPRRPYRLEGLMFETSYPNYSPGNQGHYFGKSALRTLPLITRWPTGWTKVIPPRKADEPNLYTPVGAPGRLCTGWTTRNTGSWDSTLTSYYSDCLAIMYTTDDSGPGVASGEQWTLRCEAPRQPVLEVRSRTRTPDFTFWVGTPGFTVRVSEDYTQIENSLYGEGTGEDGTVWRNSFFTGAWNRTDYEPLAAKAEVFPDVDEGNTSYDPNIMVHESKTQYSTGMNLAQGILSAGKKLVLSQTAGLLGTLSMKADPAELDRWHVKAGMTVKIKGLHGTGVTGINFHIAEVTVNPRDGQVECKIDTKYRDLLTLEEARARALDPMTPSKLLQVNKRTNVIEDIIAPWDYNAGSGYIPRESRYGKKKGVPGYNFFNGMPTTTKFPWESWTRAHPPSRSDYDVPSVGPYRDYTKGPYVRVDANADHSKDRWSFVPIMTASKGTIRRIEVAAYDVNGNVLEIPFHLSIYTNYFAHGDHIYMPHTGSDFSPFQAGAFEQYDALGLPSPDLAPDPSMIIGWGNADQKAGYSPGSSSTGFPATGLLVDEATWAYDNTSEQNNDLDVRRAEEGEGQRIEAVTLYAAFYCEAGQNVYFLGRMYKQEQGSS